MAVEQAQGVARHDHQGLLVGHDLQVLLDKAVLHPVLADLAGLAVGDQLVGVEGDVEVQVVVDHHLESLGLGTVALVLLDGLAVELAGGAEAVAVDAAVLLQLLGELLGHLGVMVGVDVAQGVLDGQGLVSLGQVGLAARRPAVALLKGGVLGQVVVQLDGHGVCKIHGMVPPFLKNFQYTAGNCFLCIVF